MNRATRQVLSLALFTAYPLGAQSRPRAAATAPPSVLRQMDQEAQALARRVSPTIVQVVVTALSSGDSPHQGGALERERLIASGVIVDPAGYIVTNAHVVRGAERVRVAFTITPGPAEGARALLGPVKEARLVGTDNETELAVLKVDTSGLQTLPFADSDSLRKGQIVFAFGSPAGLTNSMSMGVVSAVAREVDPARPVVFVQTDASINPGNSGGALVDANGALVGINTFILSQSGGSEGLGFAIPSGIVRLVYQQLRSYGHVHRGIIGVRADEVSPLFATALGLPQSWGLLISDVAPGSPASVAGLQIGDLVFALNGKPVNSLAEFVTDVTLRNIGRSVRLDLLRGTERLSVEIPVIERRDSLDRLVASLDPEKNLIARIGILGVTMDPSGGGGGGGPFPPVRVPSGVIVVARALYAGGVETGLQPGDVIHALNRTTVTSIEELRQALGRLKPGDAAVLQIERQGAFMYLPFEFE